MTMLMSTTMSSDAIAQSGFFQGTSSGNIGVANETLGGGSGTVTTRRTSWVRIRRAPNREIGKRGGNRRTR
jgi:hypothetical protein